VTIAWISARVTGGGFRSLRSRIMVWYGLIAVLCLLAYSAAVGISYRSHIEAELNRSAQEDLELAMRAIRVDGKGTPSWPNSDQWSQVREEEGGGHWIDVWSTRGERLLAVGTTDLVRVEPPAESSLGKGPRSLELPAGPFRVVSENVEISGSRFVVRAAVSENAARKEVLSLWRELAVLSLAVLVLGGFGGYLIARRSLGPLARLAEHARRITAERLQDRLSPGDLGTELNQLRDAFNETLARLERSFDGLRVFTAHASHELRTPLTVIRSVGEVGLSQPRSDAEYQEVIGTMLEEVDRLSVLVGSLLALARADAGAARLQIESVDLSSLAREVADRLGVLAEERAQKLDVRADGPAFLVGDRQALRDADGDSRPEGRREPGRRSAGRRARNSARPPG
jgi:signal transduction histidine kinase